MHGYSKTCFKPLLHSIFIGFEENIPFKGFLGVCMVFFLCGAQLPFICLTTRYIAFCISVVQALLFIAWYN